MDTSKCIKKRSIQNFVLAYLKIAYQITHAIWEVTAFYIVISPKTKRDSVLEYQASSNTTTSTIAVEAKLTACLLVVDGIVDFAASLSNNTIREKKMSVKQAS